MNVMTISLIDHSIREIGFDPDWTEERRREFLLDPSVRFPKSVDSHVWTEVCPAMTVAGGLRLPLPFWDSRQEMLAASGYTPASASLTEVTIVLYADDVVPAHVEAMGIRPYEAGSEERFFLGFDVADDGLTSGLSNCGYGPSDREQAEPFSLSLNEHGLFSTIEAANAFRLFSDARVAEHAPFFVYGVFCDKDLQ